MAGPAASTCAQCGAQGYQEDDDPCPGLCPECFEQAMDRIDQEQRARVFADAKEHAAFIHSSMVAIGVTQRAMVDCLASVMLERF